MDLIRALERKDYREIRSVGSHARLIHPRPPEHHLTILRHELLKVGTLSAILDDLAQVWKLDREQVLRRLIG